MVRAASMTVASTHPAALAVHSAHKLQRDMTSDSFIEVVQDAVDKTGMTEIPVQDRTRLLSDNGSGYVRYPQKVCKRSGGVPSL